MKRQSLATEWQGSRRAPRTLEGNLVKSWPSLSILSVLILQYFGHFWSCSFTKWCKLLCGRSGVTGGSLRCLFHHFHHCRENHESIKTIWRLDATFIYIYMYCMQVFVTFHIFTCSNECTLCWVQGSFWGLPIVAVHWALCFANSNSKIHFSRGQEQGGFSRQMGVYRVVSSSIELFELLQCCIWNELCITLPLTSLRGDCQQRHNHVPYNQRTVGRGVHSNSGPHLRSFVQKVSRICMIYKMKKKVLCASITNATAAPAWFWGTSYLERVHGSPSILLMKCPACSWSSNLRKLTISNFRSLKFPEAPGVFVMNLSCFAERRPLASASPQFAKLRWLIQQIFSCTEVMLHLERYITCDYMHNVYGELNGYGWYGWYGYIMIHLTLDINGHSTWQMKVVFSHDSHHFHSHTCKRERERERERWMQREPWRKVIKVILTWRTRAYALKRW